MEVSDDGSLDTIKTERRDGSRRNGLMRDRLVEIMDWMVGAGSSGGMVVLKILMTFWMEEALEEGSISC